MTSFLIASGVVVLLGIVLLVPAVQAVPALCVCVALGSVAVFLLARAHEDRTFLLNLFFGALLLRIVVATGIYVFGLQEFFGGDAITYDSLGTIVSYWWQDEISRPVYLNMIGRHLARNWGMPYLVASIYLVTGPNMLAIQFFNAILGAATAPVIFYCGQKIFGSERVARLASLFVAFFPSLVLWSSQGLKDGILVFLLAVTMIATLSLVQRFSLKFASILVVALISIFALRFYLFFMLVTAVGGALLIGVGQVTVPSLVRRIFIMIFVGMVLTYMGVLRTADRQMEHFGTLQTLQHGRIDMAKRAESGFGQEVDVSTTSGALQFLPIGICYLLLAPFPWQLASLRQGITLPEMALWWASIPTLIIGLRFTIGHRLRQALPILIFTLMLTLTYSLMQGNVGTAYRERSQLLVFYFLFIAAGYVLRFEARTRETPAAMPMADPGAGNAAVERAETAGHARPAPNRRGPALPLTLTIEESLFIAGVPALPAPLVNRYRNMYETLRDGFLSMPGATEAAFTARWPVLVAEVIRNDETNQARSRPATAVSGRPSIPVPDSTFRREMMASYRDLYLQVRDRFIKQTGASEMDFRRCWPSVLENVIARHESLHVQREMAGDQSDHR